MTPTIPGALPAGLVAGAVLAVVAAAGTAGVPRAPAGPFLAIESATYLGGSADEELREVIVDADGSLIVGGLTFSADFPVTPDAFQTVYRGEAPVPSCNPGICGGDLLIARLAPDLSAIRAATFLGGSRQDRNTYGMALDRARDIVVTSGTRSPDMPTTPGALQPRLAGEYDIQVTKLSSDLTAVRWCTYVGGSAGETPRGGLALDARDRVYVVGPTSSADFPTTPGAYQRQPQGDQDAVVFALEPDGAALYASTRLGGSGTEGAMGVVIDPSGNLHLTGHTTSTNFPVTAGAAQRTNAGANDTYAAGLTADLTTLLYATYLGGEGQEYAEHNLSWLPDNTILSGGVTLSQGFPTTVGAFQRQRRGNGDGFLSKVSARDGSLVFSTLVGGSAGENFLWPSSDAEGNIYVVGSTSSTDFPVTADAVQPAYGGGDSDGVIAKLDPTGSRVLYATYLGGSAGETIRAITFSPSGDLVVVGTTYSADFPVTAGVLQPRLSGVSDGFIVKLSASGVPGSPTPPPGTVAPPSPTPGATATGVPSSALHLPVAFHP
jgi:hypothetical protein